MPFSQGQVNSNIPLPPSTRSQNFSFPGDLVTGGRNFYTSLYFMDYLSTQLLGGLMSSLQGSYRPSGSVILPVPKKLNDVQSVIWDQISVTSLAAGAVAGSASGGLSAVMGALSSAGSAIGPQVGGAVNPLLYMTFKSPTFKEHTLTWTLTPSNQNESNTLRDIINYIKFNMLPKKALMGLMYQYPSIVFVSLSNSSYTFKFQPCAVTSVQVDYTGAGGPSFFRNGAPTNVNLTIQLKEIELWTKDNYQY
jgi:hypothetical protein